VGDGSLSLDTNTTRAEYLMKVGSKPLPFLKWAGGKRWLIAKYKERFPRVTGRYYEPFLGGASVFFSLTPRLATLSDANMELIETYKTIRDEPLSVLEELKVYGGRHSSTEYYAVRRSSPQSAARKAARFLYLNRTCWNGLYRVNRAGEFNVPIGTKSSVVLPGEDFLDIAHILETVSLRCCDFARSIGRARNGDFVYCDPPYTVKHNSNGFVKYNESIFTWEDQERLARSLISASRRGAKFAVSNADHVSIHELYEGFNVQVIDRASVISGIVKGRGRYSEVLITNYD